MATIIIISQPPTNPEASESETEHSVHLLESMPDGNDLQSIFDAITVAVEENQ